MIGWRSFAVVLAGVLVVTGVSIRQYDFATRVSVRNSSYQCGHMVLLRATQLAGIPIGPETLRELPYRREGVSLGESTDLNDIDGLRYIACLLREPNRVLPVPVLNEIVTGVSADVLKSNSESYSTEEAMAQLRDRIDQLGRDRQTANENNDDSWKKRIDAEVEQIENDFGYNQGLGGKLRQRSEFTKAKRKIAENIRRGLMVIKEHHNGLWSHLDNSIKTSGGFRYEPDREIDWLT
ncbi:hypothetical protein N9B31_06655 [Mariniblastus sp.]|nr:hypothetical protein [Mariniblastus sp.]